MLILSGGYTFLPELYDALGKEATLKFLDVFAGMKIKVPSFDKFAEIARDTAIYARIEQASDQQKASIVQALAHEYELSENRVRALYAHTKTLLEKEHGYRFRRVKRVRY